MGFHKPLINKAGYFWGLVDQSLTLENSCSFSLCFLFSLRIKKGVIQNFTQLFPAGCFLENAGVFPGFSGLSALRIRIVCPKNPGFPHKIL